MSWSLPVLVTVLHWWNREPASPRRHVGRGCGEALIAFQLSHFRKSKEGYCSQPHYWSCQQQCHGAFLQKSRGAPQEQWGLSFYLLRMVMFMLGVELQRAWTAKMGNYYVALPWMLQIVTPGQQWRIQLLQILDSTASNSEKTWRSVSQH